MGKIVEEKKKKKKGRPSLLDLQKRNLKQQQQQQLQQQQTLNSKPSINPYSKPNFVASNPNPNRRFTRRNPNPDEIASGSDRIEAEEDDVDDDEHDDSNGKSRDSKQLKVVHRVTPNQRSSLNSPTLNSGSYVNDSINGEEDENPHKKRKFNAVGDGSAEENGEKHNPTSKSKDTLQGTVLESGPTTPLPDQALLVFILDRLQKKDTYGVYSEPVDPEELPDYDEIIEHPMDFGTVRKKLSNGAYANLEQFEDDVFLICTNAMQYNSSDTIYFRQARSIHELAKKNFENLRQDSDDNEPERKPEHKPEHKIVRRGRPPTKNLKKPLGRPPIERAGSEFSDATLATGGDNTNLSNSYDLRKGPLSDKSGSADAPGRTLRGNRSNEGHNNLSADHRSERDDDFSGFTLKGTMKLGKKHLVFDENRRNTYKLSHQSAGGRETSVLTTFDGEKKLLMAVGLHTEHGFARSLARFAANLGPIAWKVASKKIERALPNGTKFGPGWVGENEALPSHPPSVTPFLRRTLPPQSAPSQPKVSSSSTPYVVESKGEKSSVKHEASNNKSSSDVLPYRNPHPSTLAASSSVAPNKSVDPSAEAVETARGLNYGGGGFSHMSHNGGGIRPNPPFQIHQNPGFNRPVNGFSGGGFGFNIASQMAKLVRPTVGNFGTQASMQSPMAASVTRSNINSVQSIPARQPESEDPSKLSGNSTTINSSTLLPDSSNHEPQAGTRSVPHHPQPSWQGLSPHQKVDSVPPDLNVRFQSPGSPNSTVRVDSPQPDLALQL